MVVLSRPAPLEDISLIKTCRNTTNKSVEIPMIDLADPEAKALIVKACEEVGFFKLTNHGVTPELMAMLESEAVNFFSLPQSRKDSAGPPDPFGYGSKKIGPNGDVGWIEYILLNANAPLSSPKTLAVFRESREAFRSLVEKYTEAVERTACEVLELMAEGLGVGPRDVLSRLIKDPGSDSCLRLNHYPANPEQALTGRSLIGFGEHTDPQIISVLRSNNTSGLQICLKDGSTWVSVPPDQSSLFVNVGDALQVMTNGRFKSVKHRVVANTESSRLSMIFFGGPPLGAKIAPLSSLVARTGEDTLYREFTWSEYKTSAYKSRLSDYRLGHFEKISPRDPSRLTSMQAVL